MAPFVRGSKNRGRAHATDTTAAGGMKLPKKVQLLTAKRVSEGMSMLGQVTVPPRRFGARILERREGHSLVILEGREGHSLVILEGREGHSLVILEGGRRVAGCVRACVWGPAYSTVAWIASLVTRCRLVKCATSTRH